MIKPEKSPKFPLKTLKICRRALNLNFFKEIIFSYLFIPSYSKIPQEFHSNRT